jgi:hypothetical protein
MNCSSSLDVMPMHTTYGGAWALVQGENSSWNIWLAQTFNILNKGKEPTLVTNNRKGCYRLDTGDLQYRGPGD